MIVALAVWALSAPHLQDWTPDRTARPLLLVRSPGVTALGTAPLVARLVREGFDVHELSWDCGPSRLATMVDDVRSAQARFAGAPLVAHGLGATLAGLASVGDDRAQVWLGPVLAHTVTPLSRQIANAEVPASVWLGQTWTWRGHDPLAAWLGDPSALGCLDRTVALDLQAWIIRFPDIPPPTGRVTGVVSLGDAFGAVEDAVPVLLGFADARIVRIGRNRLGPRDPGHLDLLADPAAHRAVAAALRPGRR